MSTIEPANHAGRSNGRHPIGIRKLRIGKNAKECALAWRPLSQRRLAVPHRLPVARNTKLATTPKSINDWPRHLNNKPTSWQQKLRDLGNGGKRPRGYPKSRIPNPRSVIPRWPLPPFPGCRFGTRFGTKSDTKSGTKSGTRSGTKSSTRSGTKSGTRSSTRSGTRYQIWYQIWY